MSERTYTLRCQAVAMAASVACLILLWVTDSMWVFVMTLFCAVGTALTAFPVPPRPRVLGPPPPETGAVTKTYADQNAL